MYFPFGLWGDMGRSTRRAVPPSMLKRQLSRRRQKEAVVAVKVESRKSENTENEVEVLIIDKEVCILEVFFSF